MPRAGHLVGVYLRRMTARRPTVLLLLVTVVPGILSLCLHNQEPLEQSIKRAGRGRRSMWHLAASRPEFMWLQDRDPQPDGVPHHQEGRRGGWGRHQEAGRWSRPGDQARHHTSQVPQEGSFGFQVGEAEVMFIIDLCIISRPFLFLRTGLFDGARSSYEYW